MAYVDIEQIILRLTEICDKLFNFEDNVELLALKMIIWKERPLFVKKCIISEQLEWSYGT